MTPYEQLTERFRRIGLIGDTLGVLEWDTATMLPQGSAPVRGEQTATLSVLRHELLTHGDVGALLDAAGDGNGDHDAWTAANLREMRGAYARATAVPPDLVEAEARAVSACEMTWRTARAQDDFELLRPFLEEVLRLTRERGQAVGAALGLDPYDALLDEFEPGGRARRIDALFDDLAGFLPDFVAAALERQAARPAPVAPKGPFPLDRQRALGVRLMEVIGFDFTRGRLDVSAHPFCGGAAGDVRITTRYDEADFLSALMGVLHETGHAMYELGLPERWRHQPVGVARGMGVHESQSMIVELQVCRGREFMAFAAPLMRDAFDGRGPVWEAENLYRLATVVAPGFIRVDADEATYPAHVILRYRLERALVAGDLRLADLPGAWAEGMQDLLGLTPPDDRLGCLQDIHWPGGLWGYFPTYVLGAMTAAQLFDAATRADPGLRPAIARGDFLPLMRWLRANVHEKGSLLSSEELVTQATGRPLDPAVFEAHLKARYLD